jgi:hypothetical protein
MTIGTVTVYIVIFMVLIAIAAFLYKAHSDFQEANKDW